MEDKDDITATHLDLHANMVVVSRHATIISKLERSADVRPFSDDCSKMIAVQIVDVAISYDCPYCLKTYIFVIKNALYVPSMNHNLIPPFILREAGLIVNDVPKIHTRHSLSQRCMFSNNKGSHMLLPQQKFELQSF